MTGVLVLELELSEQEGFMPALAALGDIPGLRQVHAAIRDDAERVLSTFGQ